MAGSFGPVRVEKVARNPWFLTFAILAAVGAAVGAIVAQRAVTDLLSFVGMLCLACAPIGIGLFAMWYTRGSALRGKVDVQVTDGVLSLGGKTLGRPRKARATLLPGGRYRIDVASGARDARIELAEADHVRELLESIGFDRREGTTRLRAKTTARFWTAIVSLVAPTSALALLFNGHEIFGLLLFVAFLVFLHLSFGSADLVIGADGIAVTSSLRRRFIPHSRIREVRRRPVTSERREHLRISPGFEIVLDDGTEIVFDTLSDRFETDDPDADPVYEAVAASVRKHAPGEVGPAVTTLARGGRSAREWIASLKTLGASGTAYRAAAIDFSSLLGVLCDADAAKDVRIAAVVALASSKEHAPKLRVALDDVADPDLRRVALTAADEDEDALAREIEVTLGDERA